MTTITWEQLRVWTAVCQTECKTHERGGYPGRMHTEMSRKGARLFSNQVGYPNGKGSTQRTGLCGPLSGFSPTARLTTEAPDHVPDPCCAGGTIPGARAFASADCLRNRAP